MVGPTTNDAWVLGQTARGFLITLTILQLTLGHYSLGYPSQLGDHGVKLQKSTHNGQSFQIHERVVSTMVQ